MITTHADTDTLISKQIILMLKSNPYRITIFNQLISGGLERQIPGNNLVNIEEWHTWINYRLNWNGVWGVGGTCVSSIFCHQLPVTPCNYHQLECAHQKTVGWEVEGEEGARHTHARTRAHSLTPSHTYLHTQTSNKRPINKRRHTQKRAQATRTDIHGCQSKLQAHIKAKF